MTTIEAVNNSLFVVMTCALLGIAHYAEKAVGLLKEIRDYLKTSAGK